MFFKKKIIKILKIIFRPWSWPGLRYGVGAGIEHERIIKIMAQNNVGHVLDVGANVGQFTLLARHWLPMCKIDAFEPLMLPAATFNKLHGAEKRIKLHRVALGRQRDRLVMNVAKAVDSSSILNQTAMQEAYFPGTRAEQQEIIDVDRLDALIAPQELNAPALLKLDVQGYELNALIGSEGLLSKIDFIYLELSTLPFYDGQPLASELVSWLSQHQYRLRDIGDLTRSENGVVLQFDALFERMGKC